MSPSTAALATVATIATFAGALTVMSALIATTLTVIDRSEMALAAGDKEGWNQPSIMIADSTKHWVVAATVIDEKNQPLAKVLYHVSGPWDSKGECEAFALSDDALDKALDVLVQASINVLGDKVQGVATSCVIDPRG